MMNLGENSLANSIIQDFAVLKRERAQFEGHWEEIARRIIPNHSFLFTNRGNMNKGNKRTQDLFDSTAMLALNKFGAILDSLLTPRNQTWHRLKASDPYLDKSKRVRVYFEDATNALFKYRYAPSANFSSQNQQTYNSLGAYGTGAMWIDRLDHTPGLRYKNCHLGEIYVVENHQGIVDKVHREFPMTARQAISMFGDAVPDSIKTATKTNDQQEFRFIHCVEVNHQQEMHRKDYRGKPFLSHYVSVDGYKLLRTEGYTSFPYAIPRYEQVPGEAYGRSPAMNVLPTVKSLNEMKKAMLKQAHRTVDPILMGPDDGVLDSFNLRPGAYNAGGVTADGRPLVHTLPTGNLSIGKEAMEEERALINDAFLVSLFQILVETPTMTATEVLERTKEKGLLLAPTIGRQQSEYLGPMIERELDVLSALGLLPPMPPELLEAKGEYTVIYDSPLSRAQRAEEASGLMRTIESALQIVNVTQNHEPLDYFNWDVIIPQISDINGVPEKWINSMEEVQQIRQGRAQEAQDQKAIQAAPAAAAMVKAGAVASKAAPAGAAA